MIGAASEILRKNSIHAIYINDLFNKILDENSRQFAQSMEFSHETEKAH